MKTILFVSLMSEELSLIAALLVKRLAEEQGLPFRIQSASLSGGRIGPVTREVLSEIFYTTFTDRSHLLTSELAFESDEIVTVGHGLVNGLCENWPVDEVAEQPAEKVRAVIAAVQVYATDYVTRLAAKENKQKAG